MDRSFARKEEREDERGLERERERGERIHQDKSDKGKNERTMLSKGGDTKRYKPIMLYSKVFEYNTPRYDVPLPTHK
jgi:hypothetical protein